MNAGRYTRQTSGCSLERFVPHHTPARPPLEYAPETAFPTHAHHGYAVYQTFMTTRRTFLAGAAAPLLAGTTTGKPKRIAAVVTEYRHNSHADVVIGKYLEGFL